MPIQISLKKSTTDPNGASGLTLGEPVFNYSNNTFWMGLGGSTAPVWIGAGICGASAAISSGTAYTVPSASAVRDYFIGVSGSFLPSTTGYVSSFNGSTGAVQGVSSAAAGTGISISAATGSVTITNTGVLSFNGLTGTLQGVSSAVAGTGISVSGATGAVTITNTGVQTFNGLTGAVTGVTVGGANTFTALQTFNSGITTSFLFSSTGSTFGSTLQVSGGATLASTLDVTGVARFAGGVTFAGRVNATTFKVNTVGGDEGGQIDFGLAATNTTLTTGVAIDIYQNKLRFFESGGNNRGAYIDLTATANSVGSNLDGGAQGYAGLTTGIPTYTYPDGVTTYNSGKQLFYQPVYSINDQSGFVVYANRTYFSLFNVGKATTISTIRIVPANTVTTGNCHLSIYDADPTTGLPKTRLWSSASIAVGSGYTKTTASPNYTVPAGYFYLAASFSSTPTIYGYQRTYSLPVFGAPDLTSGYRGYYFVADTNGFTAPAVIPTAGVTFALVDYTTANYSGVRIEFAV